jgi:hypothetical protein
VSHASAAKVDCPQLLLPHWMFCWQTESLIEWFHVPMEHLLRAQQRGTIHSGSRGMFWQHSRILLWLHTVDSPQLLCSQGMWHIR